METRPIEIRASDNIEGLVEGRVVRYGDTANVDGQPERFERGSLALSNPRLNFMHDRAVELAPSVALIDSAEECNFEARLADQYRDTVRGLMSSGIISGASMEFRPLEERMEAGVRVISLARLESIALVDIPAYRDSAIAMRRADDTAQMGQVEYRQASGEIAGRILLGVAGIISLRRKRKLLIPKDAEIEFDPTGIYLYDGYDQSRPLASSTPDAGSLQVRRTAEALIFTTIARKLAKTRVLQEVRQKIRGGLMRGAVPGLGIKDSDSYVDDDGFTVEVARKSTLCHFNLSSRTGDGYSGSVRGGRRRRGR